MSTDSLLDSVTGFDPGLAAQAHQQEVGAGQRRMQQAIAAAGLGTLGVGGAALLLRSIYLARQRDKDRRRLLAARRPVLPLLPAGKMAGAAGGTASSAASVAFRPAIDAAGGIVGEGLDSLGSFLSGGSAEKWYEQPWAIPLVAGGIGLGGYGGVRLADYLARKRRKEELKDQFLEEQQKFESALRADRRTKLSQAIENLLDAVEPYVPTEKQAVAPYASPGVITGGALTLAGLVALLSGAAAYKQRQKATKSRTMEQALREHRLLSHQLRPTPITLSLPQNELEEEKVAERRELTPEEEAAIAAGRSRWLPRLLPTADTQLPELMSSPERGAIIGGALGVLGGAGAGAIVGGPAGAAIGAPVGAGLGAIGEAIRRYFANKDLHEVMRRRPEGSTLYDYYTDPMIMSRMQRESIIGAGALAGSR